MHAPRAVNNNTKNAKATVDNSFALEYCIENSSCHETDIIRYIEGH